MSLKCDLFKNTFETFWANWKHNIDNYTDKGEFWDITKLKIKDISIEISKKLKITESQVKNWEQKLENILTEDVEKQNNQVIENLKQNINDYYVKKSNAARIRSRVK